MTPSISNILDRLAERVKAAKDRARAVLPKRFFDKVEISDDGCWLWTGQLRHGYGRYWDGSKQTAAHRAAYAAVYGPIASGLVCDHLCRNKRCVRPDHLEAVTQQVNVQRGESPQKTSERNRSATHCKAGHEFTPENTYQAKDGRRACMECRRQWSRKYYHQAKARADGEPG